MTDKPPETALDRIRAGLGRRQETLPPADPDGPAPQASPDPPEPAAPPPPEDPAPTDQPADRSGPPPQTREAPPSAGSEQPRTAPPPQAMNTGRLRVLQETVERQQVRHRKELSGARLRINLTWAAAVTLGTAVIATAAYLSLSHMQEELFQRHWPWRAHVWNKYGGAALWCINEARKANELFDCRITFGTRGPDCYRVEMEGDRFMIRCPSWERWPTDPAPRWGPDGPPQWSR